MKALVLSLLIASVAAGPAVLAKEKSNPSGKATAELNNALSVVAKTVASSGPPAKTVDKDQGDDHANPGAILRVCNKDTPAARRAAICPEGGSPN